MGTLNNLCEQCLNPLDRKGKYCSACLKINRKASKLVYEKIAIDNNLCIRCHKPLDISGLQCSACRNKFVKYKNKQYHYRKDNNICVQCKRTNLNNTSLCDKCKVKRKEYTDKHKIKLKNKLKEIMKDEILVCLQCFQPMDKIGRYCKACVYEKSKFNKRKYVHNLLAKSICPQCREPLDRKRSRCSKCLKIHKNNCKKLHESRKQNNLCVACGLPNSTDTNMCPECTIKKNIASKRYSDIRKLKKIMEQNKE